MSEITVYEKFEADLVVFEAADAELKFDVSTSEGEEECRVYHRKLRKAYNAVDKVRKQTGADALQLQRDINSEAKKIFERIDAMAEPRKALLDAKEAEEQAKIDAIFEAKRIEDEKIEQERVDAIAAKEAELAAKEKELQDKADALKAAEDRIANEKRIAEAYAQATKDAEIIAERKRLKAIEDAERDKVAAVEAEKETQRLAEVERLRIEKEKADAETKRIADAEAEMNRLAKIEADRISDENYRRGIEQEIIDAITLITDNSSMAQEIVDEIIAGNINVKIQY